MPRTTSCAERPCDLMQRNGQSSVQGEQLVGDVKLVNISCRN
jgi:hypothetical protein